MTNEKSKSILGIVSILWGIIMLLYQLLRNTVLSDIYADIYRNKLFTYGEEKAQEFKAGFEMMNSFISVGFFISLIIIVVCLIIYHKKRNMKIFSKMALDGFSLIYLGLLAYILFGWNLISVIAVIIGGIKLGNNQSNELKKVD